MRLLMHIDSLGSGGAQRQIVLMAQALAARGHEVAFNTYYPLEHFKPTLDEAGIAVRTRVKTSQFSLSPILGLVSHAREMKADAIVAFLRTPGVHAEIAGLSLSGCKIVISERYSYPDGPLSWSLWAAQQFHRLANCITVNSYHQSRRMVHEFPWIEGKLQVIRNGYDLDDYSVRDGGIRGELRLLTLASVHPRKDPLSLAKALHICRSDRGIPLCINWAGEPWQPTGICTAQAETDAYLAEHSLTDRWNWLGLQSDIAALFVQNDALIHTSLSEGFSNSIAEAMVAGTPVLIGRIGDQLDVIAKSGAGLLFDTRDPVSIADAITEFYLMSEHQRTTMGQAGRGYAEENLAITHMVDEYQALLRKLTGKT